MMPQGILSVVIVASLVAGEDFKWDCSEGDDVCGTVCCAPGWARTGTDGAYWCVSPADEIGCELCGSQSHEPCTFVPDLYAQLLDKQSQPVPIVETSVTAATSVTAPLAPTTPSSGITLTLGTFNGMRGWLDIPASGFYNFHDFLLGITATLPSYYTAENYTVVYSCHSEAMLYVAPTFKGCNIFFFVYRCPPCEARNGNIGQQLLTMDEPMWYALNCGPTFKLDKDLGVDHQFAVYMAEIADGCSTEVKLEEHVEFMFWAMVGKSVICSTKLTKDECDEAPGTCEWFEGTETCRPASCPQLSFQQGPPEERCTVCVDDELEFIPEVIDY